MKKLLTCILVIAMIATLAACGKKEDTPTGGNTEPTAAAEATKPAETATPEPTATTEPTEEPTAEPTEEPTAEPTEAPAADTGLGELVGVWNEIGDLFSRTLIVNEDGSMELRFQGGVFITANDLRAVRNKLFYKRLIADPDSEQYNFFPHNILFKSFKFVIHS